jgi:hypothetical protein
LDDQYDAEKVWILVLGTCAIIRATLAGSIDGVMDDDARLLGIIKSVEEKVSSLSRDGKTNTTGVLTDIEEAVSKLFPGWQPGFSLPLWSFCKKIDGHTFYSALLPIHPDSYGHWAGEALGFLSKIAMRQRIVRRLVEIVNSRFGFRCRLFNAMSMLSGFTITRRSNDLETTKKRVPRIRERLIVLVDHARTLASYAGATYWEYGLAALHLRYCCSGGLQDPLDRIRRRSLQIHLALYQLIKRPGANPRTAALRTQDGGVGRSMRQARWTSGVPIRPSDV